MKAIFFFFVFVTLTICTLALEKVTKIPVKHHSVGIDVLKERQARKIAKFGGMKAVRAMSNPRQKLLDGEFSLDYVTVDLALGTPWQNFTVLISSGSTRMWVLGRDYLFKTETQHIYNDTKSTTSKKLDTFLDEQDSLYYVHGVYYTDNLAFGTEVFNEAQAFGSVYAVQAMTTLELPVDGVLGIDHLVPSAYKNYGEYKAPIDTLLQNSEKKMVVLYLNSNLPKNGHHEDGFISLGGVDGYHCEIEATMQIPVRESIYGDKRYNFNVEGVGYGSKDFLFNGHGHIDTSLSYVIVPTHVFGDLLKILNPTYDFSAGIYTLDCTFTSDLEVFYVYTTPDKKQYIPINPSSYLVDIGLGNGECALAFELNGDTSSNDCILGTPVARTQCIAWDFDNNTINLHPKYD